MTLLPMDRRCGHPIRGAPVTAAVLLSACRTAIGTSFKGTLRDTSAFDLATLIVRESVQRSGVPAELFDDVILGEVLAGGGDIARYAALEAGLTHVPGLAHNRHCASGLSTIATAAGSIRAGMDRVVVAGGVHSSSTAPVSRRRIPGTDRGDGATLAHALALEAEASLRWRTDVAEVGRRFAARTGRR
jgi:acetyl-CoA acetyltransferase